MDVRAYRILIIDDDESMHLIWRHYLKKFNFKFAIEYASSYRQAEAVFSKSQSQPKFDIVITDVKLEEDLTGVDLWIKYQHRGERFVFSSALSCDEFSREYPNAKNQKYLSKPITQEKIEKIIEPFTELSTVYII